MSRAWPRRCTAARTAWHRDHGTADEAIRHAIAAEAYAEAAELIQGPWISYANTCRYDTVLAWLRRFPEEILSRDVQLLLIEAWVLSLSAKREEAALAIAAVERLGDLERGAAAGRFQLGRGKPDAAAGLLPVGRCRRPAGKCPPGGRARGPRVAVAAIGVLGARHGPVLPG